MHAQPSGVAHRDLVCIGGSAGALGATGALLSALGAAPVAVCVVHHIGAMPSVLDAVLQRSTKLAVRFAEQGQKIEIGNVYLAPPDRHLLVEDGQLALVHGPRENRARPAIDPLFRSAAVSRGSRSIGVLLSGHLDDGVAGLDALEVCGGAVLVQSPDDADVPDMPSAAIAALDGRIIGVASARELGFMVADIAHRPAPEPANVPESLKREHSMLLLAGDEKMELLGGASGFVCPECNGPLSRVRAGVSTRFRCDVGHAYTPVTLAEHQRGEVDQALWVALRALDQRCKVLETLMSDASLRNRPYSEARLREELDEIRKQREVVRRVLLGEPGLSAT